MTAGTGDPVFRTTAQAVVIDLVVTDSKDRPVIGLSKEDFEVIEGRHPQEINFFQEHTAANRSPSPPRSQELPNTFSNIQVTQPPDPVNVLLFDSLNTPFLDQTFVRSQAIKYLKSLRPGTPLAIFVLSTNLEFVQGFTADPAVLLAALGEKISDPSLSPLLKIRTDDMADQQAVHQMEELKSSQESASFQRSIDAMKNFLTASGDSQTSQRVDVTLFNLKQLGRYLAGIPGRKNVMWFSGSFPISIEPDPAKEASPMRREYWEEVKKTAAVLAAARVSLYPIDARGLQPSSFYDASVPPSNPGVAESRRQSSFLQNESKQRNAENATMDELAWQTGGKAFYNTNGLDSAMTSAIENGAHFYTLTYTPTNKNMDGQYRRVDVKLLHGNFKLGYRRGYYAIDKRSALAANPSELADPLHTFMGLGMPTSDQIRYSLSIHHAHSAPPEALAVKADPAAGSKWKVPVATYDLNFSVSAADLHLELGPEGLRHGSLNLTFAAYDRYGETIYRESRSINIAVKPELYSAFLVKGLNFRQLIDLPKAELWLRVGIYDPESARVGTIELPMSAVKDIPTASQPAN